MSDVNSRKFHKSERNSLIETYMHCLAMSIPLRRPLLSCMALQMHTTHPE